METPTPATLLATRWKALHRTVSEAATRAGRDPDAVTVVAVTKSAAPSIFPLARDLGIRHVGENRIPEALRRMVGFASDFRWHFVGPLQSNKVRKVVAAFDVLHGIDSIELMQRVDRTAAELGRTPEILLQVNVSGEASKQGLAPEALAPALEASAALRSARVRGLMTMAPRSPDPDLGRAVFAALRTLREAHGGPPALPELSMGMSDDFEAAVEEGATLIRIGRHLVDALD